MSFEEVISQNDLEKLRQFTRDVEWFRLNYNSIKKRHKGQHVAVKDSRLQDSDKNIHSLLHRLKERYSNDDVSSFVIEYIDERDYIYALSTS